MSVAYGPKSWHVAFCPPRSSEYNEAVVLACIPSELMQSSPSEITYDIQLQPGESLALPPEAKEILGPGNWRISIRPAPRSPLQNSPRNHSAFLNSYAPEDEGLYDDYSAR